MSTSRSLTRVGTTVMVVATLFGSSFQLAQASPGKTAVAPAASKTKNLIKNPGAESGPGSANGSVVHIPSWTTTGATSVKYGATGGFPGTHTTGPPSRGKNFFAGGPHVAEDVESMMQTVQLGTYGTAIDAGQAKFTFKAWLGGYASDADNATVYLTFYSASHAFLRGAVYGPVTAGQRHSKTKLMMVGGGTAQIPATARSVDVDIEFDGANGAYNNGYADNLSLILTGV